MLRVLVLGAAAGGGFPQWNSNSEACRRARATVCEALLFKTDVLWAQLDALHFAYVAPGLVPPGAFTPTSPAP